MARHLVFDYDWSLINCNSDYYVFEELAPDAYDYVQRQTAARPGEFNAIIDEALVLAQSEYDVTKEQIRKCLASVPVLEGMIATLKEAAAAGVTVHVVSDASYFFINSFLDEEELSPLVANLCTNKSYLDESGFLRLRPYWSGEEPHGCELCPPNLCKGRVLCDDLKLLDEPGTIVYVGDGSGDFCAATRLRASDVLLVRDDPDTPSARGLVRRIARESTRHPVRAQVVHWKSAGQVQAAVRKAFHLAA